MRNLWRRSNQHVLLEWFARRLALSSITFLIVAPAKRSMIWSLGTCK